MLWARRNAKSAEMRPALSPDNQRLQETRFTLVYPFLGNNRTQTLGCVRLACVTQPRFGTYSILIYRSGVWGLGVEV